MEAMDSFKNLIDNVVYCSTTSLKWSRIIRSILYKQNLPDWVQLKGGTVIPFYQGRVALWNLCHLWKLNEGDEILMPAYNCGTEVDPFLLYGAKVIFYRVDQNTCIDYDDLKNRCTEKTRIVYIIHYFGWPQKINEIYTWCKEKKIYVVEDCALSLFSFGQEGCLGTLADASIFSFRKTFSVPDGAALVLRYPVNCDSPPKCFPSITRTIRNLLPFVKSTLFSMLNIIGLYKSLRKIKIKLYSFDVYGSNNSYIEKPDMPLDYYFDKQIQNWSMSRFSASILNSVDIDQIVNQRRDNYMYLLDTIKNIAMFRPLFTELPFSVCPLGLVVIVPNRAIITKALNACGIAAFSWWEGYHQQLNWNDFPEACYLKDHALFLPINQTMNKKHMDYIGMCMKYISEQLK